MAFLVALLDKFARRHQRTALDHSSEGRARPGARSAPTGKLTDEDLARARAELAAAIQARAGAGVRLGRDPGFEGVGIDVE